MYVPDYPEAGAPTSAVLAQKWMEGGTLYQMHTMVSSNSAPKVPS